MKRRAGLTPSHLRLVFSADAPGDDTASVALLNDFAGKMVAITNDIADRAVDAMLREVAAFGFDLDTQALAAIRDPVLRTIAAGFRARIMGATQERDIDPEGDDLVDDPDDDLHPYVEHTGVGLRERLRLILEPGDEPA